MRKSGGEMRQVQILYSELFGRFKYNERGEFITHEQMMAGLKEEFSWLK